MSGYPPYQTGGYAPPPGPTYAQHPPAGYPSGPSGPNQPQPGYPPYPPPSAPAPGYPEVKPSFAPSSNFNSYAPQGGPYQGGASSSNEQGYGYGAASDPSQASSSNGRPPITHEAQQGRYSESNGNQDRRVGGAGQGRARERSPRGRRPPRAAANRERDSDSVASRIARERPCRTLFVRNVNYEADNMRLRASFESYGDVKDIYDMVNTRGMLFITYFDLRVADRARGGMHGTLINGRPIDVHYSLPKDTDTSKRCDREKNQGSVLATGRGMRFLDERQVGDEAARHGAVKIVRFQREASEKLIEFYDSRDAARFVDNMDGRPFAGGTLQLQFVWDDLTEEDPAPGVPGGLNNNGAMPPPVPVDQRGPPPAASQFDSRQPFAPPGQDRRPDRSSMEYDRGRGGSRDGEFDRGWERGRGDADRMGPPPGPGSGSGSGSGSGYGGGGRGDDRYAERPPPPASYGENRYPDRPPPPPGPAAPYSGGGVPPAQAQSDDRLEQARKVQQLLANLASAASPLAPAQASAPPPVAGGGNRPAQGQTYGYDRKDRERSRDGPPYSQPYNTSNPPPPQSGGFRPPPPAGPPQPLSMYPAPPAGSTGPYPPPQQRPYDLPPPPAAQAPRDARPPTDYPPYAPPPSSHTNTSLPNRDPRDPRLPPRPPPGDPRLAARPPAAMPPPSLPNLSPPQAAYGQSGPFPGNQGQGGYGRPPPPAVPPSQGYEYGSGQGYQPRQPGAAADLGSILANLQPNR